MRVAVVALALLGLGTSHALADGGGTADFHGPAARFARTRSMVAPTPGRQSAVRFRSSSQRTPLDVGYEATARIPAEAFHGDLEPTQRLLRGVRQRVRTGAITTLRTRVTRRGANEHPALVTALREVPDAVLVAVDPQGYRLAGPIVTTGEGERARTEIRVERSGERVASVVSVATGNPVGAPIALHRDFRAHPAITRLTPARGQREMTVYSISDIHGAIEPATRILIATGVARQNSNGTLDWSGGDSVLVINGDALNKDPHSIQVIDMIISLTHQAQAAGGSVIMTLGNHELRALADPQSPQKDDRGSFRREVRARGESVEDIAMGRDTHGRGTFLRNLPLAAHVGDIFFSHTGDTNGRSMRQLESEFERAVNEHGYRSLTQDDHDRSSLLGSSFWESRAAFRQNLRALNQGRPRADRVRILSYGHAPSALGRRITGKEFRPVIGVARHGRVINTDTGMSAHMRGVPHAVRFRLVDGETTSIQSIDGTGAAGEELLERR